MGSLNEASKGDTTELLTLLCEGQNFTNGTYSLTGTYALSFIFLPTLIIT